MNANTSILSGRCIFVKCQSSSNIRAYVLKKKAARHLSYFRQSQGSYITVVQQFYKTTAQMTNLTLFWSQRRQKSVFCNICDLLQHLKSGLSTKVCRNPQNFVPQLKSYVGNNINVDVSGFSHCSFYLHVRHVILRKYVVYFSNSDSCIKLDVESYVTRHKYGFYKPKCTSDFRKATQLPCKYHWP